MQCPASCSARHPALPQTYLTLNPTFSCHMRLGENLCCTGLLMALLCVRYVLIGSTLVALLYCDSYALLCGRSRDSSGSVVTLRTGRLGEGMHFFFSTACRPAPEFIQQNIQWLLGLFFQVPNVKYVSRPFPYSAEVSMSDYIPPFPHTPLWRATQLSCGTQLWFSLLQRKFRIDNILCKLMT